MKFILIIFSLFFVSIIISSCMGPDGPDGVNGNAYLQFTNSDGTLTTLTVYGQNGLPDSFSLNNYYKVYVGTYSFSYDAAYTDNNGNNNSITWTGSFTITVNAGTKGGSGKIFWQSGSPGIDGSDKYYTMDCAYTGPNINAISNLLSKRRASSDSLTVGKNYSFNYFDNEYQIHLQYKLTRKNVYKNK